MSPATLVFVLLNVYLVFAATKPYQYGGGSVGVSPEFWSTLSAACGTRDLDERQTPINIQDSVYDSSLRDLKFDYPNELTGEAHGLNNGRVFEVEFDTNSDKTLSHGPLGDDTYELLQFHMHWGAGDLGSEHFLEGQQHAVEVHFVHLNSKYVGDEDALSHSDALAVVGVFLDVCHNDFDHYNSFDALISEMSPAIKTFVDTTLTYSVEELDLNDLLPRSHDYYTYRGSLTTPGCNEIVTWIVMDETHCISKAALQTLQSMHYTDGDITISLGPNFRPLQPLNGRTIRNNFENEKSSASSLKSILF